MGSVELLLLAGADLLPASKTGRKHGHCQGSRAESQRGTRPESIKALRDKSHSLQPTGLQELHNCLRSKRSQVRQDALPSDTVPDGGHDSVFTQPVKSSHLQGHPTASIRDRPWSWRKGNLWVPAEQISRGKVECRKFQSFRKSCSADRRV